MTKKKSVAVGLIIFIIVLGFIVPIGSYKVAGSCGGGASPVANRLNLVLGQTLGSAKNTSKESRDAGCSAGALYTLYLL